MDSFSDQVAGNLLTYAFFDLTTTNFAELIAPNRSLISASEKDCIGVMRGVCELCVLSVSASLCIGIQQRMYCNKIDNFQ